MRFSTATCCRNATFSKAKDARELTSARISVRVSIRGIVRRAHDRRASPRNASPVGVMEYSAPKGRNPGGRAGRTAFVYDVKEGARFGR